MPFKSLAMRRKFYALKNEGKMDQKTIDEWEKDTPKNLPERLTKKAFLLGFEKRATEDVVHKFTDVHINSNSGRQWEKGSPPIHMEFTRKRPWLFGKTKHMEQAKNPPTAALAMGSPVHNIVAAKKWAKENGAKVRFTKEHKQDFLASEKKNPTVTLKDGGKLSDEHLNHFYDRMVNN